MFAFSTFVFAGASLGTLGMFLVVAALVALAKRRPWRFVFRTLLGVLLLIIGGGLVALGVGINGYRALTREEIAALVEVQPTGPQQFRVVISQPDRAAATYELKGDAFYVDAHVIKWMPVANLLGLHTSYELDRVAGRYNDLTQEQTAERTVHSLAAERPVDLFGLRRQYAWLSPFFDAEYGSGSFVAVTGPAKFEVRVSTTGLLIRPAM